MKTTRESSKTKTAKARVPKDGKVVKDAKAAKEAKAKVAKAKAAAKRRNQVIARNAARSRAPRTFARLARLTDPRAALVLLTETKGVIKAVEGSGSDLRPPVAGSERYTFAKIPHVLDIPDLIELQKESFHCFITEG